MAGDNVDLDNRDPNNLNDHVKCEFEDVFGEPEGSHSMACIWTNSYKCFNCTKSLCYMIVTLLCGLCIAFHWGCVYAYAMFEHIWCITPSIKLCEMNCTPCRRIYSTCIDCCIGPVCEALGLCCSRIKIEKGSSSSSGQKKR